MSNTIRIDHPANRRRVSVFLSAVAIVCATAFLTRWSTADDALTDKESLPEGAIARLGSLGLLHGGAVTGVEFTPDGTLLLSAGRDSLLRLWKSDHTPAGTLSGYSGVISRIVAVDDRPLVAAVAAAGDLHLIDVASQTVVRKIANSHGTLRSLQLSANGKYLVGGHSENLVILWDAMSGDELCNWQAHEGWVTALAFSPDSSWLASGGQDFCVRTWDIPSGERRWEAKEHKEWVWGVDVSADGGMIASASWDNTVGLWNARSAELIKRMTGHEGRVWTVRFSSDRARPLLASGGDDNKLVYWDPLAAKHLVSISQPAWVNAIGFSTDGMRIAFGREDQRVRLQPHHLAKLSSAASNDPAMAILPEPPKFVAGVFAPGANHLATISQTLREGTPDGALSIYYLDESTTNGHSDQRGISAVEWSDDAKLLVYGTRQGHVVGMKTVTGIESREMSTRHLGEVMAVDSTHLGEIGRVIVSAGQDGMVRVSEFETGNELRVLRGHQGWVTSLALVPGTNEVVTGGQDHSVCLWNLETGRLLHTFEGHTNWVRDVDVSADGAMIASAGLDETVRVWDRKKQTLLHTFDSKRGEDNITTQMDVYSVAFAPDGQLLVTAGEDRIVRFWNLSTGKLVLERAGHLDRILSVDFSESGQIAESSSEDGTVLLWRVPKVK